MWFVAYEVCRNIAYLTMAAQQAAMTPPARLPPMVGVA